MRKYWHAMYKEIKGTGIINRERTANLFLMAVIYSEVKITLLFILFYEGLHDTIFRRFC